MDGQFHAPLGGMPFGTVAPPGFALSLGILWDSRWQLPLSGPARSALAAGFASARCGIAQCSSPPESRVQLLNLTLPTFALPPSKDHPSKPQMTPLWDGSEMGYKVKTDGE